jgi:CRP-like cAMP-binding protein
VAVESLEVILKDHPFIQGLDPRLIETMTGCVQNRTFAKDEYLCREGEKADVFFLIRAGHVGLEVYVPTKGPLQIDSVDEGEVLGWAWLIPPYRWHFDARAVTPVRAFSVDAKCLRNKSEQDHELGYHLMQRFAPVIGQRMEAALMKLVDIYGK